MAKFVRRSYILREQFWEKVKRAARVEGISEDLFLELAVREKLARIRV